MNPGSFFEIVKSPEVFEFRDLNLMKLYYDYFTALVSGVTDWAMKPMEKYSAAHLLRSVFTTLRLIFRQVGRRERPVFFFGAAGRLSVMDGTTYDLYNARIAETLGREQLFIYQIKRDAEAKTAGPDLLYPDIFLIFVLYHFYVKIFLRKALRTFTGRLLRAYPQLGFTPAAAEKKAASFYRDYLVYCFLLRLVRPRRALLICHYFNEAFVNACKKEGVPVIELQHGHINRTHAYYDNPDGAFPPSARTSFPDQIIVYGNYWRDILIEKHFLPPEDILVGGYYLKLPEPAPMRKHGPKKKILFTTQPTIQEDLLAYFRFLRDHLNRDEWELVIRPHPAEESAPYHSFEIPGFISISYENTYALLNQVDVHMSAYSTVIYEATRYPVCNYALYVERVKDRWEDVMESGAARPLRPDELPVLYALDARQSQHFFAEYNSEVIRKACGQ